MSVIATAVKHLLAAGVTGDALVAAIAEMEAARPKDATAEKRREWDRERKRKAAAISTVIPPESAESAETPSPLVSPPKVSPDPFKKTPPISPQPTTRGARLPDDFTAPADWISWAMAKRKWDRAEATDEAECFARYWQAKTGKDAVKRDWFKTWQNWVTNSRRATSQAPPAYQGMPC